MFKPLTKEDIGFIVDLQLDKLNELLAPQEFTVELTPAAKTYVIDNGYDPTYGARPLRRYLQTHVETLTARMILAGNIHTGDIIVIDLENGRLTAHTKEVLKGEVVE